MIHKKSAMWYYIKRKNLDNYFQAVFIVTKSIQKRKDNTMAHENDGHRTRLRQRLMKEGASSFQDHEVLLELPLLRLLNAHVLIGIGG